MSKENKSASKRSKKSSNTSKSIKSSKKVNFFLIRRVIAYFLLGLGYAIWYIIKYVGLGIYYSFKWLFEFIFRKIKNSSEEKKRRGRLKESGYVSKIDVILPIKGGFKSFWSNLKNSDSLIGIVIGARGSGKSAIAMCIAENLKHERIDSKDQRKTFAMGFSNAELPNWIKTVDDISEIENNSFVVIDEGGILFSSRESMSDANKMLSSLLFIARHKNLSILFISQNSSNLEINTLRQADYLIFKRSSLLQKEFERKIIAEIYDKYEEQFKKYSSNKGIALIYSDKFIGFVNNELPSFWSSKISKSYSKE